MKNIFAGLLSLFIMLPSAALAEVENWYTYWAIGAANHDHNYPGELDTIMSDASSTPGTDRSEIGLDMYGFYWPYNNNTLLGFVISGSYDRIEDRYNDYVQLNQFLYGLSSMHFFGQEIGDGFYVRGDAGVSYMSLHSSVRDDQKSDQGIGALVGVGYAWAISEETRILFGISYSSKNIEGDTSNTTALTIGGLW